MLSLDKRQLRPTSAVPGRREYCVRAVSSLPLAAVGVALARLRRRACERTCGATGMKEPEALGATPADPREAAVSAGLVHVSDEDRGIRRERAGDGFRYYKPSGDPLEDEATLERVRKLAIPPAWTDVWICPKANGHLQA